MEDGERMNQAKPSPIIKIDALGKESVNAKLDQPDDSSSGIKREYIKAKDQADGSDDEYASGSDGEYDYGAADED